MLPLALLWCSSSISSPPNQLHMNSSSSLLRDFKLSSLLPCLFLIYCLRAAGHPSPSLAPDGHETSLACYLACLLQLRAPVVFCYVAALSLAFGSASSLALSLASLQWFPRQSRCYCARVPFFMVVSEPVSSMLCSFCLVLRTNCTGSCGADGHSSRIFGKLTPPTTSRLVKKQT